MQAAATLIAAQDSGKGQIDVDECITPYRADLCPCRCERLAGAWVTRGQVDRLTKVGTTCCGRAAPPCNSGPFRL